MNCEKAYCYMFNRLSDLREQIESLQVGRESINTAVCINQLQLEAEEIRMEENMYEVVKAPRSGSTKV